MELKEGMYVRTKKGIFQITNDKTFIENGRKYIGVNGRYTCIGVDIIEKASHNIIDLIEVGDYVNGFEVQAVDKIERTIICYTTTFFEEDINSIVTKEQFERVQYVIK